MTHEFPFDPKTLEEVDLQRILQISQIAPIDYIVVANYDGRKVLVLNAADQSLLSDDRARDVLGQVIDAAVVDAAKKTIKIVVGQGSETDNMLRRQSLGKYSIVVVDRDEAEEQLKELARLAAAIKDVGKQKDKADLPKDKEAGVFAPAEFVLGRVTKNDDDGLVVVITTGGVYGGASPFDLPANLKILQEYIRLQQQFVKSQRKVREKQQKDTERAVSDDIKKGEVRKQETRTALIHTRFEKVEERRIGACGLECRESVLKPTYQRGLVRQQT